MATVIETVERDGKTIHVYDTGLERDAVTGYIIKPAPHTIISDPERATELHRANLEKKRERARMGANAAIGKARPGDWENPQDLDFVEAIVEAQTVQALLVGDTSSTKAAEFVMRATGLDERQTHEQPSQDIGLRSVIGDLARIIEGVNQLREDAVDGTLLTETPISVSNNKGESSHNLDQKETDESDPG